MSDESNYLPDDTPLERGLRSLVNYCVGAGYVIDSDGPAFDGSDDGIGELEEAAREVVRLLRRFREERRRDLSEVAAEAFTATRTSGPSPGGR